MCSSKMSDLNERKSNISAAGDRFFPVDCLLHLTAQMRMTFGTISPQYLSEFLIVLQRFVQSH